MKPDAVVAKQHSETAERSTDAIEKQEITNTALADNRWKKHPYQVSLAAERSVNPQASIASMTQGVPRSTGFLLQAFVNRG